MLWLVFAAFALVPLLGFAAAFRLSGGRYVPAVLVAAAVGAGLGAFLASAGSAMASAVDPTTAMLQGGGIGLLGGAALGGIAATLTRSWRRSS
jgi:hypothetical protein